MKIFLTVYITAVLVFTAAIFFLSYNEGRIKPAKSLLTVIYITALAGLLFSMIMFENRYGISTLKSSIIAAASLGLMYAADTLAGKLNKEGNTDDN